MKMITSVQLVEEIDAASETKKPYVGLGLMGKRDQETLIEVVKLFPDANQANLFATRASQFSVAARQDPHHERLVRVPFISGDTMIGADETALHSILETLESQEWRHDANDLCAFYGEHISWTPVAATSWWHGDLSFENVVITNSGQICFIDWRPTPWLGDVHYEYGKLLKSTVFDHSRVHECSLKLLCPWENSTRLQDAILTYASHAGLSAESVKACARLILKRMAKHHDHVITRCGESLGHCLLAASEREFP